MIATLTSKGQITVPKSIRDHLHISTGDKVDFRVNHNGTVELVPIGHSVDDVFGCLSSKVKTNLTIEEMNSTIASRFSKI